MQTDLNWNSFKKDPLTFFKDFNKTSLTVKHKGSWVFKVQLIDTVKLSKKKHRCKLCKESYRVVFIASAEIGPGFYCRKCRLKFNIKNPKWLKK